MKSQKLLVFCVSVLAILIFSQIVQISIPETSAEEIFLDLLLVPPIIVAGERTLSIGYVNIVDGDGVPVLAGDDIKISLVSSDPTIATVSPKIVIPKGQHYANFNVNVGNIDGNAEISAILEDQIVVQNLIIGSIKPTYPDDLELAILIPSTEMHVNTEMPLSVILKSSDGAIITAIEDTVVSLDYEEFLIEPTNKKIILKKGSQYGITSLKSLEETGNAFIRAKIEDLNLNSVSNIKISSTRPSTLQLYIFPDRVTEFTDKTIDIFVGLEDTNGLSTVAAEDININISADDQQLSDRIKDFIGFKYAIIKKGEYGIHLQPNMIFPNTPENYTIAVSSDNYQSVSKLFDVVELLSGTDAKVKNKAVKVFVPPMLPTGAKTIVVYQIGAIESDDDDPEGASGGGKKEGINVRVIDDLKEGEIFPVQIGKRYTAIGEHANLKITSSDNSILSIVNPGSIVSIEVASGRSVYGVAVVSTSQKTGDVTISISLDAWGSGKATTTVVNPLEPTQTKIFSPGASNKIVLDNEGWFELFFLPLDSSGRPASSEKEVKYLIQPINELAEIQPKKNFVRTQLFAGGISGNSTDINVVPVGVGADPKLETTTTFELAPTSTIKVILPFERLIGVSRTNPIGVVQLTDLFGNPVQASKDLSVKLSSSNEKVVTIPKSVTIPAGSSFVNFPVTAILDKTGIVTISSDARNVKSFPAQLFVESPSKSLKIFVEYPDAPIGINQGVTMKVFVDDERAKPVEGVLVKLITSDTAQASPNRMTTSNSGEASFIFKTLSGPTTSFTIEASKVGYVDGEKTIKLQVGGDGATLLGQAESGTPSWVIYIIIGIAVVTAIIVVRFIFLKPKKEVVEGEEEYEEGI